MFIDGAFVMERYDGEIMKLCNFEDRWIDLVVLLVSCLCLMELNGNMGAFIRTVVKGELKWQYSIGVPLDFAK